MTTVKVRDVRTGKEVDDQVTGWEGRRLYTVSPQGNRRTWTLQGVCFESARLRLVDPAAAWAVARGMEEGGEGAGREPRQEGLW